MRSRFEFGRMLERRQRQHDYLRRTSDGSSGWCFSYNLEVYNPESVKYIEIVASISSKSAGAGTRANIDEFTQTTSDALSRFTETKNTKAIIILNSAEPPVHMRNTIYALIDEPNLPAITKAVRDMERRIQKYVPGYRLLYDPVLENGRVTTAVEVVGQGDYLPKYAGNLDIITCAAVEVAERYAQKIICESRESA